jgi:DNA repair exonuclease SbcCD ATPase subunit
MQVSNFVLFGAIETLFILLMLSIGLLFYTRNLKGVIKGLQDKLSKLLGDLKESKAAVRDMQTEMDPANAYQNQINDQLQATREYHLTLGANQDIALDLNTEVPLDRQVAAFRHAMLIAEKEALHASEDENPNWAVLQSKLSQLIQFYQASETASDESSEQIGELNQLQEELNASKKRVDNLEKFKKLFFDMESKWSEAKDKANDYHQELSSMAGDVADPEGFNNALNNYHKVYDDISDVIHSASGGSTRTNTVEITRDDPQAQSEIRKLRSVAADQHKIIAELERKLQSAETVEQKDSVIQELSDQLQRQTRFVQESETCIQLLEEELNHALEQLAQMGHPDHKTSGANDNTDNNDKEQENQKLRSMVQKFSSESQGMLQKINELEQVNQQLQIQPSSGNSAEELQVAQQELLNLQTQYAELEEHYLELKMKG